MKKFTLPFSVAVFVFSILSIIQIMVQKPLLLLERFFDGGGWVQIIAVTIYAYVVAYNMQDPAKSAMWRRNTWMLFSFIFFTQLVLGLFVSKVFLMTGKLHVPVPALILSGPIYRSDISVMTILFLSTVVLSGPAWCSHICYFGAIDNFSAKKRPERKPFADKFKLKHTLLIIIIFITLLLRWLGLQSSIALIAAILFGIIGLVIIFTLSKKKGKMAHCVLYCPIGTIVSYYKHVSPFRMYIDDKCTTCMKCTLYCKYDALSKNDILNHQPGLSCTLCGDCITTCHTDSIKYKFFKASPEFSRNAYLFISIGLHAVTLAMARI